MSHDDTRQSLTLSESSPSCRAGRVFGRSNLPLPICFFHSPLPIQFPPCFFPKTIKLQVLDDWMFQKLLGSRRVQPGCGDPCSSVAWKPGVQTPDSVFLTPSTQTEIGLDWFLVLSFGALRMRARQMTAIVLPSRIWSRVYPTLKNLLDMWRLFSSSFQKRISVLLSQMKPYQIQRKG